MAAWSNTTARESPCSFVRRSLYSVESQWLWYQIPSRCCLRTLWPSNREPQGWQWRMSQRVGIRLLYPTKLENKQQVLDQKEVCFTDRNIGYYYIYLNTYLASRLLCGVGSSSLCYHILRRPYQDFVSSTLIQQQYLCQWLYSSTYYFRSPFFMNFKMLITRQPYTRQR